MQCADDTLEAKPNAPLSWMQRLRRVFAIDISTCPRCGGKVRVIAAIMQEAGLRAVRKNRYNIIQSDLEDAYSSQVKGTSEDNKFDFYK